MSERSSPATDSPTGARRTRGSCPSSGPGRTRGAGTRCGLLVAIALAAGACGREASPPHRGEPIRIAAAADLALAFQEIGAEFERTTGKKVAFTFGSTGLLAKQIAEGAPFEVFAAANAAFVDDVVKSGACVADTKELYARGRIVLWAEDPKNLPPTLEALREPRFAKIALANPDHAPYGKAAQQAMTKAGVWTAVSPRAVFGENVQQTLTYAQSGNADVAIVALSLATVTPGKYLPIDPSLHEPLDQALVICKGGALGAKTNEARAFVRFVAEPHGRAIMRRYGFLLPGESLPDK